MGESGGGEAEDLALEYTPTWIVAAVCSVIVIISLVVERALHRLGKYLKRKNQKPLFEALQKIKEELMILGFISLLLVVLQDRIQEICIPHSLTLHLLPCSRDGHEAAAVEHLVLTGGTMRRLLGDRGGSTYCKDKGKVPLLSLEAIHELHIFIFVLAVTHVVLSALTMLLGGAQIRHWKHWEDAIQKGVTGDVPAKITHLHQDKFIRERFRGIGKDSMVLSWLHSFLKQFYGSVTKSDYTTMRLGFIMTHCKGNQKLNFFKYMVRALEADFKKVVGISWYLWIFVVVFLVLDVHGWHTYFWLSFIPLILLLVVGTKLEHVIAQLAHDVAEKNTAIEGDLVVTPSDYHFWFHRPKIILHLIHFILFQNAFEISFFFWVLTAYGFDSCIMGSVGFIVPRLVICVIIQLLCSYSTLPLYAIVTQMGSSFRKAIFDENVQEGLAGWARKVRNRRGRRIADEESRSNTVEFGRKSSVRIQMQNNVVHQEPYMEDEEQGPAEANGSATRQSVDGKQV